jgi:hypothetical protein
VPELMAEQKQISAETQETFGSLDARQLNWQPNLQAWSIGQCFDHLLNTNTPYFPEIESVINGRKRSTVWQKLPFFPRFFGRFIMNSADPRTVKTLKSPSVFQPSTSTIDANVLNRFLEGQHRLLELMAATEELPLEKIIITSPVARFVTYSLMDAYTIMALHNRRHFNQAKRVMEASGFPEADMAQSAGTGLRASA